jgi:hypothetical protein
MAGVTMTGDDLRKIFLGTTMFRLDTILGQRLVPILYATGLAGILLWAVTHLFATFGRTFGDGLWGLLEIAVFGLLGIVALRIACEVLLVYFKTHESTTRMVSLTRMPGTLVEEVREAISEIADEEEETAAVDEPPPPKPATPRRTAKRSPPPATDTE